MCLQFDGATSENADKTKIFLLTWFWRLISCVCSFGIKSWFNSQFSLVCVQTRFKNSNLQRSRMISGIFLKWSFLPSSNGLSEGLLPQTKAEWSVMIHWRPQIPLVRSTNTDSAAVLHFDISTSFIHGRSFRVQPLRKLRMSYGRFTTDGAALTYCQQECGEFSLFCWPAFCWRYVMWRVVRQPPREAWQNSPKRVFLVLIQGKKCAWFIQLIWFVAFNSVPRRERMLQWILLFLVSVKQESL